MRGGWEKSCGLLGMRIGLEKVADYWVSRIGLGKSFLSSFGMTAFPWGKKEKISL